MRRRRTLAQQFPHMERVQFPGGIVEWRPKGWAAAHGLAQTLVGDDKRPMAIAPQQFYGEAYVRAERLAGEFRDRKRLVEPYPGISKLPKL